MSRVLLALFAIILVCPLCFAGVGSIIPIDDIFYDQIDALAQVNGLATPNTGRPWTVSQAQLELGRIVSHGVKGVLVDHLQGRLDELKEDSFEVGFTVAPEFYVHTNGDEFDSESDWVHGFADRQRFAVIDLNASIKGFSTYCELTYGWGKTTWEDTPYAMTLEDYATQETGSWTGLGADIPVSEGSDVYIVTKSWLYSKTFAFNFPDMDKIEIETPRRTYVSYATDHFSISFSRDRLSWGSSDIGNFIFSESTERQNYISMKAFAERYGFDYVIFIPEAYYGKEANSDLTLSRLFLAHRFYARPFDRLWIAASENAMYSYEDFDLSTLNPSFILHQNTRSKELNALAHLEIQYVPFNGFQIWTQFALDQATAPTENDSQDPAWGLSGGLGYVLPMGDGGIMDVSLECAYTTPALYRRNNVDFIIWTRYSTNHGPEGSGIDYRHYPFFQYLGFPYGGDCIATMGKVDYLALDGMRITLSGQFVVQGGFGMFESHNSSADNSKEPNLRLSTPSDGGIKSGYVDLAFSLPTSLALRNLQVDLELRSSIAVAFKQSCAPDFQISLGISSTI